MQYTKEEVEAMVDARVETAILKYHKENTGILEQLRLAVSELRQRIIGIDGNGTGQIGAVQRIEQTLKQQTWIFLAVIGTFGTAVVAVGAVLIEEYVKFHAGWR